jgi:hypothetical protein
MPLMLTVDGVDEQIPPQGPRLSDRSSVAFDAEAANRPRGSV